MCSYVYRVFTTYTEPVARKLKAAIPMPGVYVEGIVDAATKGEAYDVVDARLKRYSIYDVLEIREEVTDV